MPRQQQMPDLKKYMAKQLRIKLNGNRVVTGRLSGFDVFMNLVVEEASEEVGGAKADLGVMVIRGNSVIQVEALEHVE